MIDDKLYDVLRNHLPSPSPDTSISSEDTLTDLGIDSLRLVELIIDLEESFKIVIPEEEMLAINFHTVGAVSTLIGRILPVTG